MVRCISGFMLLLLIVFIFHYVCCCRRSYVLHYVLYILRLHLCVCVACFKLALNKVKFQSDKLSKLETSYHLRMCYSSF